MTITCTKIKTMGKSSSSLSSRCIIFKWQNFRHLNASVNQCRKLPAVFFSLCSLPWRESKTKGNLVISSCFLSRKKGEKYFTHLDLCCLCEISTPFMFHRFFFFFSSSCSARTTQLLIGFSFCFTILTVMSNNGCRWKDTCNTADWSARYREKSFSFSI